MDNWILYALAFWAGLSIAQSWRLWKIIERVEKLEKSTIIIYKKEGSE